MRAFWESQRALRGEFSPSHRNRATIAVERQILQDDDDIAELDLIDCYTEHFTFHDSGTSRVPALAICVRSEDIDRVAAFPVHNMPFSVDSAPFSEDNTPFSIALRHKDHHSCAVGAVAFHLFDRFQVSFETEHNAIRLIPKS